MSANEYLLAHQNTLLITSLRLDEVQGGIDASRCTATIRALEGDWGIYPYSDSAPDENGSRKTMYLIRFAEPDHGAKFQEWYDAQQSSRNAASP